MLPVELSNVNDLPIMTNTARVRQWFGDNPGEGDYGFQIYFLDANAYGREPEEEKSFWVKGESRAEILVKVDREMKRLVLNVTAGPVPTEVVAEVSGRSQHVALPAGGKHSSCSRSGPGIPMRDAGSGPRRSRAAPASCRCSTKPPPTRVFSAFG